MKSDFLKKIIAATVITSSIGTLVPISAAAIDFYAWQMQHGQSNGTWIQSGGNWYYYDYSGIMQTGWIYDKGKWYYADSYGVMQTGVIQVNGNIYLLSNTGAMQTGHAVVNGKYYNFDETGVATGNDVPTPNKSFNVSGESVMPYVPNQVVTISDDDSSPNKPSTVARDPQNLVKYNVIFKDDDGEELKTKSIEKGEKATLYTPTKTGYTFVEWNTKKNGDGTSYEADETFTVNKNVTLYAQWKDASSSSSTGSSTNNVLVENINVSAASNTISTQAGTLQMSANVLPIDASNKKITWSVEAGTGKATISESGLLTASADGTVAVVATAQDGSKITGRYNVTISGQSSSTGGSTGGNTGGSTGGNTGGTTTTGGRITAFDPNIRLSDVVISDAGNIVDLSLLKVSGKLPTTAKVSCSLSDGTVKEIEMPIAGWSGTFDGTQANTYVLTASLGAIPTGYTSIAVLPTPTIKVIVQTPQVDGRIQITGVSPIDTINLAADKHIMNTALLNSSGILPSTVTLVYAGGTVTANVKSWSCTNADNSAFNGSTGIKNLVATVNIPAGYVIPGTVTVNAALNVTTAQTANIQSLIEVQSAATSGFTLNYALNDTLDLSKLRVKVRYNDNTEGYISYSQFADNGITTPGYFQGYPLSSLTSFLIPVTFNNNTVYTERVTVAQAVTPTVTTSQDIVFNMDSGVSHDDVVFTYTLGTGSKKVSDVKSISLGTTLLSPGTASTPSQYTVDTNSNTITIKKEAIESFYNNAKITPSSYQVSVLFNPAIAGGTEIKPASNPLIHFISTPTLAGIITLAPNTDITPLNNTIKLLNIEANVQYEYCVVTTGAAASWTSAKSFASTTTYKELTDTNFTAGKELYIRKKSISDGLGATNPASTAQGPITISASNISRTLSNAKAITSFSITGTDNVAYVGTITEGSTSGTIKVIVPTVDQLDPATNTLVPKEMPVTSLIANAVTTGKTITDANGNSISGLATDFTSPVKYTVTAEDGTTRDYTVTLYRTQPQATIARNDIITYNVSATTTASVNILTEYGNAGIGIDRSKDGLVVMTVTQGPTGFTDAQKAALENIRNLTPYTDPQSAYVGMKFTPTTIATSVKIASTLDGLKTATAIPLSSSNMLAGCYLERVPVAANSGISWSNIPSVSTKYYQWLDIYGNTIGYTSVTIKVQ